MSEIKKYVVFVVVDRDGVDTGNLIRNALTVEEIDERGARAIYSKKYGKGLDKAEIDRRFDAEKGWSPCYLESMEISRAYREEFTK